MYKWLISIFSLILVCIGATGCIYKNAMEPVISAKETAIKRMAEETDLTQAKDFYLYQGSETYYVISGTNQDGEEAIAWIPENKKDDIIIKEKNEGTTKKFAVEKLLKEKNPKEILNVKLGMEKKLPVWEIVYLDENSNLNYYYVHFDTGKWWRKIENL